MPKRLLITLVGILLVLPLFFQLATTQVSADDTVPVTNPVTFFNLVGQVTYKQLGRLLGNTQRIVPAEGVVVTVTGFFDKSQKFTTTTDSNGNYNFDLTPGMYSVRVKDASHTASFFVPPLHVERVKDTNTKHANFQGLIFPSH